MCEGEGALLVPCSGLTSLSETHTQYCLCPQGSTAHSFRKIELLGIVGTCLWVFEKSFGGCFGFGVGFLVCLGFFLKCLILMATLRRARLWSNYKRPFVSRCMSSGLSSRSFLSL